MEISVLPVEELDSPFGRDTESKRDLNISGLRLHFLKPIRQDITGINSFQEIKQNCLQPNAIKYELTKKNL